MREKEKKEKISIRLEFFLLSLSLSVYLFCQPARDNNGCVWKLSGFLHALLVWPVNKWAISISLVSPTAFLCNSLNFCFSPIAFSENYGQDELVPVLLLRTYDAGGNKEVKGSVLVLLALTSCLPCHETLHKTGPGPISKSRFFLPSLQVKRSRKKYMYTHSHTYLVVYVHTYHANNTNMYCTHTLKRGRKKCLNADTFLNRRRSFTRQVKQTIGLKFIHCFSAISNHRLGPIFGRRELLLHTAPNSERPFLV